MYAFGEPVNDVSGQALFGGTVIRIHHRRGARDAVLADFDDSRFIQLSSNNLKNISFGKLGAAHGRLRQIIPQIARHGDGFVAYFFFVLLIIAPGYPIGVLKHRSRVVGEPELRSAEGRVGKEVVSTCSSRWLPFHKKKKKEK